jgi:membrane associated rhomboid family serine protease
MLPLGDDAKVCVRCGIYPDTGRPVLTRRAVPADFEAKAEEIIGAVSWAVPFGLYPIYSEAKGWCKPYVTWGILALTILTSIIFWIAAGLPPESGSDADHLMLWSGSEADEEAGEELSEEEIRAEVMKRIEEEFGADATEEQKALLLAITLGAIEKMEACVFQWYQLFTHAFLHGGIFHLIGNMLFLLVLGSRTNSAVGNVATAVLYLALAAAAGVTHMMLGGDPGVPMLGASGAIMGLAGMYVVLFPLQHVFMVIWLRLGLLAGFRMLMKMFATRGVYVVMFYIAFDVLYTVLGLESGTAHWAHLGGFFAGVILAILLLIVRMVHTGNDVLSLALGKSAWPLIGTPASHQ